MTVMMSVWNPPVNTWVPVFNFLEDDINATIANPKWVKAVKGEQR